MRPARKPPRQAGMAQVAAVGMAFVDAIMLTSLLFLATGQGTEEQTIWVFPLWIVLFVILIWEARSWYETLARGLAILGTELLALPLAWLGYRGMPALSATDPRLAQAIGILGPSLVAAAITVAASIWLWRKAAAPVARTGRRVLLGLIGLVFLGELGYWTVLWASLVFGGTA